MKKTILLVALLCCSFLTLLIHETKADDYLGIKVGTTYTFTYTVSPQIRGVTRNIDLPVTINAIDEKVAGSSYNVIYQTSYKIEQDGIPVNQDMKTSRIINQSMDLKKYVNESSSPFDFFFIFKTGSNKETTISDSDHSHLGTGTVKWDDKGILLLANFTTKIDNQDCTVTIAPRVQSAATPGYSVPLIGCMLVGTVVFIVIRLVKKEKKNIACP